MKRAVVISFNWETEETMHMKFEGAGCADRAAGWAHKESFLRRDFPASEGWTHFVHWNSEAGDERGVRAAKEMTEHGTLTETVPV